MSKKDVFQQFNWKRGKYLFIFFLNTYSAFQKGRWGREKANRILGLQWGRRCLLYPIIGLDTNSSAWLTLSYEICWHLIWLVSDIYCISPAKNDKNHSVCIYVQYWAQRDLNGFFFLSFQIGGKNFIDLHAFIWWFFLKQ